MSKLRTAVIGCGHLGRIHARLLSEIDEVELVAVVDPCENARESVADACGARPEANYESLVGTIDAAVVATPTSLHHAVSRKLISAGVHVLVEKPLAPNPQECEDLVQLANRHEVVVAVGHVERFNPAFVAAQPHVSNPLYIEATRTGGFSFRSMDVGVVLDLMIHDLELVLALVDSPVSSVSAVGAPVVSAAHEDFAEARVVFGNGCVAALKASRTSPIAERRMSIYGPDQHVFIDFDGRRTQVLERSTGLQQGTLNVAHMPNSEIESMKDNVFQTLLPTSELMVADTNPLRDELLDFVSSVQHGRDPRVDGAHAGRAVWLADQIVSRIGTQQTRNIRLRRAA